MARYVSRTHSGTRVSSAGNIVRAGRLSEGRTDIVPFQDIAEVCRRQGAPARRGAVRAVHSYALVYSQRQVLTRCALHDCALPCPRQVLLDVMRDGKTMKLELALTTCALLQMACHRAAAPSTGVVIRTAGRRQRQAPRTDARTTLAVHTRIGTVCAVCLWALLTVVGRAASRVSCHSTCTMRPKHLLQQARSNQQSKVQSKRNRPLRRMRPNR